MLCVPGVNHHHLEAALLEDLEHREPVHPGRFHDHCLDAAVDEPVGQTVKVSSERPECPHRLLVPVEADRRHVKGCADINRRCIRMHRR